MDFLAYDMLLIPEVEIEEESFVKLSTSITLKEILRIKHLSNFPFTGNMISKDLAEISNMTGLYTAEFRNEQHNFIKELCLSPKFNPKIINFINAIQETTQTILKSIELKHILRPFSPAFQESNSRDISKYCNTLVQSRFSGKIQTSHGHII